jgi:hypothetical protein
VTGCCECGDEPWGSCATELVSVLDSVQVLDVYVSTSLTGTLHINVLVLVDIKCDFRCCLSAWKHLFAYRRDM